MNAPAETAPATNPAYLNVLEALVQINEPAERERIATKAGISPDGAGVQLVALAGKRIVVRCPQPNGAPALWSLAVSLSTARQMVAGMKRAAAEASPAADDRRRIIAAMREIGKPASAFGIAKKSGVETSIVSVLLEMMTADGAVQRIGGTSGQRPKFALAPSVQSTMPTATDGEPGDGSPGEDQDETTARAADPLPLADPGVDDTEEALARRQIDLAHELQALGHHPSTLDDPDDFGDDEAPAADDRTGSLLAVADGIATAVAAGECPTLDTVTIVSDADVRADRVMRHTGPARTDPETPIGCAIARVTGQMIREAQQMENEAARLRHIAADGARIALEASGRLSLDAAAEAVGLALRIIEDVQE